MSKMSSRTFWIVMVWAAFVPLSWWAEKQWGVKVAGAMIPAASAITTAYIGKRAWENSTAMRNGKDEG